MREVTIKTIALLGVLAVVASCANNEEVVIAETAEKGLFDETISHDNLQREYLLYVPESYTGNEPVPLVFSLHGAGGTKESQYGLSQFNLLADRENFILVTPQATSILGNRTFWNQQNDPNRADDVGFINTLLDEVASRYNIDLDRVYLAGSSNGAFMALEITCQLSQKIAATAAVKGYMLPDQVNSCNPTTPTAIIQMHGTEDPLVPYRGVAATLRFWAQTNQTALQPTVSHLPDTDPDNGNTVVSYLYKNGTNGVEIEHLEVIGGGHDWFGEPGTDYDIKASEEAWDFFTRFDSNGLR
jgi:polyhydroxybutyrate depolymerase